jgi:hypothetical protein
MAPEHALISPIACQFNCSLKIIVNSTHVWLSGNQKCLELGISTATMTCATDERGRKLIKPEAIEFKHRAILFVNNHCATYLNPHIQ